jgi:hypothetical protein
MNKDIYTRFTIHKLAPPLHPKSTKIAKNPPKLEQLRTNLGFEIDFLARFTLVSRR